MTTPKKKKKAARKRTSTKKTREKSVVERSGVKITPYPRAGDNKDFEGVLDRVGLEKEPTPKEKPGPGVPTPSRPGIGDELLTVPDVAEWVAWPFMLWAQTNTLPALALSAKEANSVAEPLTSILNRHGASRVMPPDMVDGLKAGARLTPIMATRLEAIKKERERQDPGKTPGPRNEMPPSQGSATSAQGAAPTKPVEI